MSRGWYRCRCPYCGGEIKYNGDIHKHVCYNCNLKFKTEELEALQEKLRREKEEAEKTRWNIPCLDRDWGEEAAEMKAYSCPSCGAELMCEESTAVTACPYCSNYGIINSRFQGPLKPEYVLPFVRSHEDAVEALKKHYKHRLLLPRGFVDSNHIQEIKGVYVPYWMYEVRAEANQYYRAIRRRKMRTLLRLRTKTDYYQVYRSGSMAFDRKYIDASRKMPDSYMLSLEPFDFESMKPFSTAYLPGYLADRYDVMPEESSPVLERLYKEALRLSMRQSVSGYTEVELIEESVRIVEGNIRYVLLPVWLLSTNWKGENYLFAMNGQSGKMVGELPVCRKRLAALFAAVAGPLMAIGTVLSFLLR